MGAPHRRSQQVPTGPHPQDAASMAPQAGANTPTPAVAQRGTCLEVVLLGDLAGAEGLHWEDKKPNAPQEHAPVRGGGGCTPKVGGISGAPPLPAFGL